MIKVRMLQHIVSGKPFVPGYTIGELVDLEDRVALAWLDEGYCVRVSPGDLPAPPLPPLMHSGR